MPTCPALYRSAAAVGRVAERAEQQRHVIVLRRRRDGELDLDDREEPGHAARREVRAGLEPDPVACRARPGPAGVSVRSRPSSSVMPPPTSCQTPRSARSSSIAMPLPGRPAAVSRTWVVIMRARPDQLLEAQPGDLGLLLGGGAQLVGARVRRCACARSASISSAVRPVAHTMKMKPKLRLVGAVRLGELGERLRLRRGAAPGLLVAGPRGVAGFASPILRMRRERLEVIGLASSDHHARSAIRSSAATILERARARPSPRPTRASRSTGAARRSRRAASSRRARRARRSGRRRQRAPRAQPRDAAVGEDRQPQVRDGADAAQLVVEDVARVRLERRAERAVASPRAAPPRRPARARPRRCSGPARCP